MTVSMNLWHLTLTPGEKYPVYVKRDFVITNAALGEELVDNSGRSVVKVTHQPINPDYFSDHSDCDSDMSDDDLPSDLDELAEEDEEEAPVAKGDKKAAAADKIEIDEDEEEEDDEDYDSEDDTPHVEAVMCALTAGKIEQATINLTFVEGEIVVFEATGKNEVHLMGNYINQFPSEEDSDDEDEYDEMYESGDESEQSYDEEELEALMAADGRRGASKGKITEIPEAAATPAPSQKRKADAVESPAATEKLSKAEKKKLKNAEGKAAAAPAAAAPAAADKKKAEKPESASAKGTKKTLPSGLIIEDTKVGTGPVAKAGKRLGMRYIGKLENGKQFDANTGGKPFQFVLGKGEVISGWDQGIVGMAVGGERRLTIPASLAYGSQKIPGIPKNSTLKFDIKLVEIK